MATQSTSIVFNNASNASIRVWGSAVSAGIQACGLVKTADTGQIDWTTTTANATSLGQVFGYEMYRLNDALQTGGKPIYVKVEYGVSDQNAQSATTSPGIWTTVGTSTDGAGNISSTLTSPRYTHNTYAMHPTTSVPCYFSGDGTYFFMILGAIKNLGSSNNNNTPFAMILLDRTRNADGTSNGDGWWTIRSCFNNSGYVYYGFPANQANTGADGVNNPTVSWREDFILLDRLTSAVRIGYSVFMVPGDTGATGADGADVTFYPMVVQSGHQTYTSAMLCGFNADVVNLSTYTTTVLGASHTYLCLKHTPSGMTNHAMLVRYE